MNETERKPIFDYHDNFIGHVTLMADDEFYYLYVGHRDLQFRKDDGSCVGGGTLLLGPANRYCPKCHDKTPEANPC